MSGSAPLCRGVFDGSRPLGFGGEPEAIADNDPGRSWWRRRAGRVVLIPREMLEGMPGRELEIREEPGRLLVLPADDPILSFGEDPLLDDEVTDASVDRYPYGSHGGSGS